PSVKGEIPLPKTTHLVIVLDNSYSMSVKSDVQTYYTSASSGVTTPSDVKIIGERSAFEIAKEKVSEYISAEKLGDTDAISLIKTSETYEDYFKKSTIEKLGADEVGDKTTNSSENADKSEEKPENAPNIKDIDTDVLYTTDKGAIERKLKDTGIIPREPNWIQTLELVKLALNAPGDRFEIKTVVIISDCQKRNFEFDTPAQTEQFKTLVGELTDTSTGNIQIVDVGNDIVSNCAITEARLVDNTIGIGVPMKLIIKVKNLSIPRNESQIKDIKITYSVDGGRENHLEEYKNLNAGDEMSFIITEDLQQFEKPGIHAIQLSIQSYDLTIDNRCYLIVDVIPAINMLVINGDPQPKRPQLSETFAFELALPGVSKQFKKIRKSVTELKTFIESKVISEDEITGIDFFEFDLIVFANVNEFKGYVPAIERYILAGNPVIFTLGDKINRQFYNKELYKDGIGFFPGKLVEIVGTHETLNPFKMIVIDQMDRSIKSMYDEDNQKTQPTKHLQYPSFYIYYKLKPQESSEVKTIITLSDKPKKENEAYPPLLIEKTFGKGIVSVFTSSLDANWNSMQGYATYIAFWHELVYKLTDIPNRFKSLKIGEQYRRQVSPKEYAQNNLIFPPGRDVKQLDNGIQVDVRNLKSAGREGAFRGEIIYTNTSIPGIYTLMMVKNRNTLKSLVQRVLASSPDVSPPVRFNLVEVLTDKIIEARDNREQSIDDVLTESVRKNEISEDSAQVLKTKLLVTIEEFMSEKEVKQSVDMFAVNLATDESDIVKLAQNSSMIQLELDKMFGKEKAPIYISAVQNEGEETSIDVIVPKKSKIWRFVAYALFILLALEMIFALVFTNRQR
ncbi:MAG: hypothetical protein K8S87_02545, partial [Planctomycetes bacterium]|nr:hypothetical protein [Planctomycetota bacterium]